MLVIPGMIVPGMTAVFVDNVLIRNSTAGSARCWSGSASRSW